MNVTHYPTARRAIRRHPIAGRAITSYFIKHIKHRAIERRALKNYLIAGRPIKSYLITLLLAHITYAACGAMVRRRPS
jgi:hypothetical protein